MMSPVQRPPFIDDYNIHSKADDKLNSQTLLGVSYQQRSAQDADTNSQVPFAFILLHEK